MYINFKVLTSHKITAQELLILQAVKQSEFEMLSKAEAKLLDLQNRDLLTTIKGKSSEPLYLKFRLSKKGKTFLRDLEVAEITESSLSLSGNLIALYENEGLEIANKKEVVELVSWFLSETNFDPEAVYQSVSDYLNSTEKKFISNLNNLIWKSKNVYSTKWSLTQSKLYGLMTSK